MAKQAKKAVILFSGGLDSSTLLSIAKNDGFEPYVISFRYGQRHSVELEFSKKQAKAIGCKTHNIIDVDLSSFSGSALTDSKVDVPKSSSVNSSEEIPVTYVPARNIIFLSYALGYAEIIGAKDIFIGVNAVDYSGYPDCRPEFIASFQNTANLGTKAGVGGEEIKIHAPLINLSKSDIIRQGLENGIDYSNSLSCYDPVGKKACGECDSCKLRLTGFKELGVKDPFEYI